MRLANVCFDLHLRNSHTSQIARYDGGLVAVSEHVPEEESRCAEEYGDGSKEQYALHGLTRIRSATATESELQMRWKCLNHLKMWSRVG